MDEAFISFEQILGRLTTFGSEFTSFEAGVRTYVSGLEIDTPVELDVTRDETGALRIGTTPPLYLLRTSVSPSLHRLRFAARLEDLP